MRATRDWANAVSEVCGSVVAVRGSVVDVRFDQNLPPIYSVLHAGKEGKIVIEVLTQTDDQHVRGIAMTPTQGLARGAEVTYAGSTLEVPVGNEILSRMFDVFGDTIDDGPSLEHLPRRSVHQEPPTLADRVTSSKSFRPASK